MCKADMGASGIVVTIEGRFRGRAVIVRGTCRG